MATDLARAGAPSAGAPDRLVRAVVLPLLVVLTVALFLRWDISGADAPPDARSELVVATAALVILSAIALAVPSRWSALAAAVPSLIHLTDLGPVLWPTTGALSWAVKVVVCVGSAIGVLWIVAATLRSKSSDTSPPWLFVPVGIVLILASLGLPWAIVSNVGVTSGSTTAWELIMGPPNGLPPGVAPIRTLIMLALFVALVSAIVPIFVHSRPLVVTATTCVFGAFALLVALQVYLAVLVDAVEPASDAPGLRVALAGLLVLGVVWTAPRSVEPPIVAGLPLTIGTTAPDERAA